MNKEYIDKKLNFLFDNLSKKKKTHVKAVLKIAYELGSIYNIDMYSIKIAVMSHDAFKELNNEKLNEYVEKYKIGDYYLNNRNLSHGKIAAKYLEINMNIKDEDIINSVSYHTTGRANMSMLEKIIYIADAIEPARRFPGVNKIRKLTKTNIDEACILCMNNMIKYLNNHNLFIDEDTLKARDYLVKINKEKINEK